MGMRRRQDVSTLLQANSPFAAYRNGRQFGMHIIATFFLGLVVGIVAKLLMPGRDPGGFIITSLLGIAGAFVAKFIGQQLGWYRPEDAVGFIASVGGAVVLLILYRLIFHRRRVA